MCGNCDYHSARAEQQRKLAIMAAAPVRTIHERLAVLHDEQLVLHRAAHDRGTAAGRVG